MRIDQIASLFMIGLVSLLSVSCNSDNEPGYIGRPTKERQDIILTRSEQAMVDGHAKFGFDFFREYNKLNSENEGNMIVSPLSLAIDLSILANAIDDDSYVDFLKLMDIDPSTTRFEMNDLCKYLVDELLHVDSQVDLIIANSIWTDSQYSSISEDFANEVMEKYGTPVQSVSFNDKESEKIINGWVKDVTNNIITDIHTAGQDLAMTTAKLYNILYFNGEWSSKFNRDQTTNRDFNNLDGTISNVPMMCGESVVYNVNDDNRSIIKVPFGNYAYNMYFVLPDENQDFDENIAALDFDKWTYYRQSLQINKVRMIIPKLDFYYNAEIMNTLDKMGLHKFMTGETKLTHMFTTPQRLEYIAGNQACSLKLEENGVTTNAVTVTSSFLDIAPTPINDLVLDRPFMFLIEESSTGAILFMGKVVKM